MAARARYLKHHTDAKLEDLVIYTTTQTHSLGAKAGLVLGLEVRALDVKVEDSYALRGSTLKEALEADLARGKRPFIVSELCSLNNIRGRLLTSLDRSCYYWYD